MTDEANKKGPESTRRKFLTATTALAGAALAGLPGVAGAERKRNPKRGGTVRFGTRDDSVGLDTHRNFIYFVSQPMAGTTGFNPDSWCVDCSYYKVKRAPKARPAPDDLRRGIRSSWCLPHSGR